MPPPVRCRKAILFHADEETLAALIRITGGNFRLLHRCIAQIARLVAIDTLHTVTCQVVEAARERLVIRCCPELPARSLVASAFQGQIRTLPAIGTA
jgi:hypothetical protein